MMTSVKTPTTARRRRAFGRVVGFLALCFGACLFIFPFYDMVVGALQAEPDPSISGAFPSPNELSLTNFHSINERVPLLRALFNSVVYTGGVILGTVIIGILRSEERRV